MVSRKISDCVPELQAAWFSGRTLWEEKYPHLPIPFITCTFRDNLEQERLYNIGRTTPGRVVTWAKPGQSPHNYKPSYAFDIAFLTVAKRLDWNHELFSKFAELVPYIEWGGNWRKKDRPHFQVHNWRELIKKKNIV